MQAANMISTTQGQNMSQNSVAARPRGGETQQFKGMRFCSECDNMLDAKEHRGEDGRRYL